MNVFKEQVDMVVVDSEGEESESAMSVLDDSEQEPISQPEQEITGETGVVAQPSYRLIGRRLGTRRRRQFDTIGPVFTLPPFTSRTRGAKRRRPNWSP